jgi:hypothetical protein
MDAEGVDLVDMAYVRVSEIWAADGLGVFFPFFFFRRKLIYISDQVSNRQNSYKKSIVGGSLDVQ